MPSQNTRYLDPHEIEAAAKRLGCEVAVILAVRDVEAGPTGFGPDNRPLILFEPHVFSRYTKHRFDATRPDVSWPKWDRTKYVRGQTARWAQWNRAAVLDRVAAIKATSYGLFQVMGFNARICGWKDEETYHVSMFEDESQHLRAFLGYVEHYELDDELRRRDFDSFAAGYNGPRWRENNYGAKMRKRYAFHKAALK